VRRHSLDGLNASTVKQKKAFSMCRICTGERYKFHGFPSPLMLRSAGADLIWRAGIDLIRRERAQNRLVSPPVNKDSKFSRVAAVNTESNYNVCTALTRKSRPSVTVVE